LTQRGRRREYGKPAGILCTYIHPNFDVIKKYIKKPIIVAKYLN